MRRAVTACLSVGAWLLLKLLMSLSSNALAALIVGLTFSAVLGAQVANLWWAIAANPR